MTYEEIKAALAGGAPREREVPRPGTRFSSVARYERENPIDQEAQIRGAVQAVAPFADEAAGLAVAAGKKLAGDGRSFPDVYRAEQEASLANYKEAQARSPDDYLRGQVVGTGAAAAVPLAAAKTAAGAILTSGGMGAAMGLGASEEKTVKGKIADTAIGFGVGAAIPSAVAGGRRAVGYLSDRLDKSKVVGALTKHLRAITERGGDPEKRRKAAGLLIQASVDAAGDAPVPTDRFRALADSLAKSTQNPYTSKLDPLAEEAIAAAEKLAAKKTTTLAQLQEGLEHWTSRHKDLKKAKDMAGARIAKMAKDAIADELEAATGNPDIADAARGLIKGRADYRDAKNAQGLQEIITNSADKLSPEGAISPSIFAGANSGKNAKGVAEKFAGDPEGKKRWDMAVNAARMLAKRGDSWLPPIFPPRAQSLMNEFMTSRNAMKIFGDGAAHAAFMRLMSPGRTNNPERAAAAFGQFISRVRELGMEPAPAHANSGANDSRTASVEVAP